MKDSKVKLKRLQIKKKHTIWKYKEENKKTGSSDLGTSSRVYSERPKKGETK